MISLADHAERVSRRRAREPLATDVPTAAERLAAIRRRVSSRAAEARGAASSTTSAALAGEVRRGGGEAVKEEACQEEEAGRATRECWTRAPSNEDVKMHQTRDVGGGALQRGARDRAPLVNDDAAAAACYVAWHSGADGCSEARVT